MHAEGTSSEPSHAGGCLCGAVRYEVSGPLRGVVVCHCEMCSRTHGHFAAYTAAPKSSLRMVESRGLGWYASSARARRGFCRVCGASVFWEANDRDSISIAAGTLDAPTGLATVLQVHTTSAGDYYALVHGVPQRGD